MTREEAIHFAECLKHNWTIDFNDMEDFCDMAIEALSEPRGDLISRKDALNLSCIITGREGDAETIKKCFEAYRDHIVVLPSAETHEIRTETHGVCSDLISREAAIEAVRERKFHAIKGSLQTKPWYDAINEVLEILSALPSAEPCDKDAISREGLLKSWEELSPRGRTEFDQVIMTIPALPSAEAETVDCTEFIRWLTETVMDDGMWELNAVAYGEVIARKLTKLGVLEVKDDVYVYKPSAEAKTKCIAQIKVDTEEIVRRIKEECDITDGWIPCKERLPEENGEYIVSLEDSVYPWAKFFNGKWFMLSLNAIAREFGEYEVIAWKPMPEPYREDGEI